MSTFDPTKILPHQLHRVLLSAVAPRPIAFASTIDKAGNANLSPFSCFNVFGVNPSTLIFSPSRSGRTNELKDTYLNIKEVPEVVINMVAFSMVEQMNLASTEFPRGINEFVKSGFTPLASEKVKPFRVKESPVQIECKVRQVIETGDGPGAANLIICEAVMVHVNDNVLDETGAIDTTKLDLVGRLGAEYYVRASGSALFTLDKPASKLAIGVDSLPETVRLSNILTGNDLGKLGSIQTMPSLDEIDNYISSPEIDLLKSKHQSNDSQFIEEAHKKAQSMIADREIYKALLLLLTCNKLISNDL
jgi:flavin reductase (DIM6/NTAB) family NADH-FMN oxidoreductase RutF